MQYGRTGFVHALIEAVTERLQRGVQPLGTDEIADREMHAALGKPATRRHALEQPRGAGHDEAGEGGRLGQPGEARDAGAGHVPAGARTVVGERIPGGKLDHLQSRIEATSHRGDLGHRPLPRGDVQQSRRQPPRPFGQQKGARALRRIAEQGASHAHGGRWQARTAIGFIRHERAERSGPLPVARNQIRRQIGNVSAIASRPSIPVTMVAVGAPSQSASNPIFRKPIGPSPMHTESTPSMRLRISAGANR